jgi:hypothetical protein
MRFQVFTDVKILNLFLWVMTLCRRVRYYQRFCSEDGLIYSSETSITTCKNTWRHNHKIITRIVIFDELQCFRTRTFITMLTTDRYWTQSWARWIQYAPSHYTSSSYILILSFHLRLRLPCSIFSSDYPNTVLYEILFPLMGATRPAHPYRSIAIITVISTSLTCSWKWLLLNPSYHSAFRKGIVHRGATLTAWHEAQLSRESQPQWRIASFHVQSGETRDEITSDKK